MKRDMELCREILFALEEQYVDTAIVNLKVVGHGMKEVAYHCKLLYEAGFVASYNPKYGSNTLLAFSVGGMTWDGHEFLDKIREDTVWNKTKDLIKEKGLPMALEVVKNVATTMITVMTQGAIQGLKP